MNTSTHSSKSLYLFVGQSTWLILTGRMQAQCNKLIIKIQIIAVLDVDEVTWTFSCTECNLPMNPLFIPALALPPHRFLVKTVCLPQLGCR
jgi:hypothetical protein